MKSNKFTSKYFIRLLMFALLVSACELIDPTDVVNPDITQEKLFEDATGGAQPLLTGLEYAFAEAIGKTVYFTEAVSDNYDNTSTYLSTVLDKPRDITPNDQYLGDDREIYFKLQTIRALADFGLSTVLPADDNSTDYDEARTLFFKGMAILMLCENFQAFPLAENGSMVRSETAIQNAISALESAYQLHPAEEHAINCKYALARAYRIAKDKAKAVQSCNEALGLDPAYVLYAEFDPINLFNEMTRFIVTRPQNDLQPLPRLDFLDPKFNDRAGGSPIPVLKAEEAYLILSEASLSNGDLSSAKNYLIEAIQLAGSRETSDFMDNDPRKNRPSNPGYKVKADAAAEEVEGLILERNGNTVTTHPVSFTSLTPDDINMLQSEEGIFRALYLIRQEIFFAEGRRMSDLGIRLPVMQRQFEANPNIHLGDYGTEIFVPNYIPETDEMDAYTVDDANGVVTIMHDMNKILAANRTTVSPF